MMKPIIPIVLILLFVFFIGYAICNSPEVLRAEYSTSISVETPDKIENSISNVVFDLEKRDFVPVYLKVMWCPASKTYKIYAKGIDRTKLGKYEP